MLPYNIKLFNGYHYNMFRLQWLKLSSDEVKEMIYKLAKKGLKPSEIGVQLRDSSGIAQVRRVTGNKILRILKKKGSYLTSN